MQEQVEQPSAKKTIPVKTIALVVFVIIATIFAVQNWTLVYVWPLGNQKPLTLVIALTFALGAVIGWLAHSILFGRRGIAPDRTVMERDER
jgi:uncharacterized integral membrane protein